MIICTYQVRKSMRNTKLRDSSSGAEAEADEHPADGVPSSASGNSSHYHRNRAAAAAGSSLESQVGNWPDNWGKERKERRRDALIPGFVVWMEKAVTLFERTTKPRSRAHALDEFTQPMSHNSTWPCTLVTMRVRLGLPG